MKKLFFLLFIVFVAIGFIACKGNNEKSASIVYKVGDYYNDGVKEGIVFQVSEDGKHGKIVSVEESDEQWAIDPVYKSGTAVTSREDGLFNMNKIKEQPDWENNYPAFAWCACLGADWYLPAEVELYLIFENRNIINCELDKRGYDKIEGYCYWSSTEYSTFFAWLVGMNDGGSFNLNKYLNYYVRAVATF